MLSRLIAKSIIHKGINLIYKFSNKCSISSVQNETLIPSSLILDIDEHGKPFRTEIVTHMCVPENGKPYERPEFIVRMSIIEHGLSKSK